MNFTVLTIFPDMFVPFWEHGIIRKAIEEKIIDPSTLNIRDFAAGSHHVTDDRPYGGGCGMVMKPEPLAGAVRAAKERTPSSRTVLMTPQGRVFDQGVASELSELDGLILVCGRYEGVDERFRLDYAEDEISIGDYVMTGGELAAMVVMDSVTRLIPGALGGVDSASKDSFAQGLLEHAHYTRPRAFEGKDVPEVLLSGHHGKIDEWRLETSLIRTFLKRPDLFEDRPLSGPETEILGKWRDEIEEILESQPVCGAAASPGGE